VIDLQKKTVVSLAMVALLLGSIISPAHAQRPVSINVGSDSGPPDGLVTIDVTLDIAANLVTATDNVLSVAAPLGIVDCQLAEAFQDSFASQVVFEPAGCEGDPDGACTMARGLIINNELEPITGSNVPLYSCDVRIASDAALGIYPVACPEVLASHPAGQPYNGTGRCREAVSMACETDQDCSTVGGTCRVLPETLCVGGTIDVVPGGAFSMLAAGIGSTDETIPLVDASLFGEAGTVEVNGERITYRAKLGNDLMEAQRGKAGTVPTEHAAGTRVTAVASNAGGAGGGRGCAITTGRHGHAAWLVMVGAILAALRIRTRRF
jgi:hypothetical protein